MAFQRTHNWTLKIQDGGDPHPQHSGTDPTDIWISGEATGGGGGLNPPLSSGATHEICAEPMRKYWGYIGVSPRNVVPANTLVLVAHLVKFSERQ